MRQPLQRDPRAQGGHAESLEQAGALAEALEAYRRVAAWDKRDPYGYRCMGRVLAALGRHAEAIDAYRQAVSLTWSDAETHGAVACSAYPLGRYKDAALHFRFALEVDPAYFDRHPEHEQLLLDVESRYSEHEEQIRRLLRRTHPRDCLRFLELVPAAALARLVARRCESHLKEDGHHPGLAFVKAILDATVSATVDEQALGDGFRWARGSLEYAENLPWFVGQLLRHCERLSVAGADRVAEIVLRTDPGPDVACLCYARAAEGSEAHLVAIIALGRELLRRLNAEGATAA